MLADMTEFYRHAAYQPFLSTQSTTGLLDKGYLAARQFMLAWKRRFVTKHCQKGSVLDIGCGTGEFLYEMQRRGWRTTGVEKDPGAVSFARKRYGLSVHDVELAACGFADHSFDVVTMWHVLEHMRAPMAVLREIGRVLKHDGRLIVALPNIGSKDAGYYLAHWVALDTPRHVSHFTRSTLKKACHDVGLTICSLQQLPLDAFFNCLMSEKVLAAMKKKSHMTMTSMVRALVVASCSLLHGARIRSRQNDRGSSVMYMIKNAEA
jgi:2-polyprenyl-3-methyl-5-hydroxy-6-metoxy-1,4-benzoquinol methylase